MLGSKVMRDEPMRKQLPPSYFIEALFLIVLLHYFFPVSQVVRGLWRCAGLLLIFLGVFLNIAADKKIKQYETTVKPYEESRVLVIEGVFGVSRNPMYLGMVMILGGVALLVGSVTPWLIVGGFSILMDKLFICPEERMLEQKFGEQFRQYRQKVRRWV